MQQRVRVPNWYDLLASIHAWVYPDVQPVPEITTPLAFGRIIKIGTQMVPLIVRQQNAGRPLTAIIDSTNDQELSGQMLQQKIEHILGLDISFKDALDVISKEPAISVIAPQVRGIRPYIADTLFEALVKSIIQQQITYRAANVITMRLVLGLGASTVFDGIELHAFPNSRDFLKCGEAGLREYGLGYKTKCILEVSQRVESGELDLDTLLGSNYEDASEVLCPIRGIGEWTLQAFMIAGLGDLTVFPYGDVAMQNLLGRIYNNGLRMSKSQIQLKSSEWGAAGPKVLYLLMCAEVLGFIE